MKNRFWSIVLAICLVLSCVPITVFAADSDATELQNLLNNGGTVQLTRDYSIDTTLNVTNTVTLDLNGYTISMTGSGSVMAVGGSGNLTMKDSRPTATHTDASLPAGGVITGGNANRGGGVSVAYGSFTLEGGTIASCSATTRGGGVHTFPGGSMTMTGGTITNCSATDGGGVFNENTFTMSGGSIANCSSTVPYASGGGGGVYNIGNFTMSDGVIENCSAASSFGGGVFSENAFTMSGGTIRGCSAKYGGGVRVDFSTFTISGGTIEACTETVNGKSDAVTMSFDASLLGNGGTIKGMVTAGSNSTIKNTSADGCTVFYDAVTNYGTISGGVYYGGIQNKSSGTVSGTYHTVSFDLNGGSGTAPIPQWFFNTNTAKALQPDDPINDAYNTFAGWYNGDTKYDFNQPVPQDITLTAKFINPKAYNISYDLDGGTATNPETYNVESDAITLNNPVKTGYTFTGWSGTGLTGENNMTVTIAKGSTGNRAYTAHFSQNSYTVKFDTVGGSSISDKSGVAWTDTVLSGITAPTKDSFEFTGWKCEDKTVNANTKYSGLAANDTVTSVTLVAQWKDIENPVITGLENGKTYCAAVEFEVSDNDKIESVKAGDEVLTVGADGKYYLSAGVGTVTVAVTDSSGNTAEVTVTVNDGHTDESKDHECEYCGVKFSEHSGGTATCKDLAVCEYCGEEYGELDSTNHNLEKISATDATVTETGNKEYWHCKDCGKYFADENATNEIKLDDTVISKLSPEIIKGKGQSIVAGEKKALSFTSNAAFSDFVRVELDGKTLDEKNYTVKEGSTVVTLKADYVATLSAGEHTIGIVSTNGTATTTFTVNAKAVVDNDTKSPQTGDNSHMALWIALLFASGAVVIGTTVYSKRKRVR